MIHFCQWWCWCRCWASQLINPIRYKKSLRETEISFIFPQGEIKTFSVGPIEQTQLFRKKYAVFSETGVFLTCFHSSIKALINPTQSIILCTHLIYFHNFFCVFMPSYLCTNYNPSKHIFHQIHTIGLKTYVS